MQCRLVTGFPHFVHLGYSSTSACEGTHALHGPQCLHGITMYSALCWPQIRHGGSARAGARPGAGGGAGACQIWLMGLREGVGGVIGGRNGRSGAADAAAASGGQYAPARPGVPPVSLAICEHTDEHAHAPSACQGHMSARCQLSMTRSRPLPLCVESRRGPPESREETAQVKRDCMDQESAKHMYD